MKSIIIVAATSVMLSGCTAFFKSRDVFEDKVGAGPVVQESPIQDRFNGVPELDGKRILSPKTIEFMMQDQLKFIKNKGGPMKLPNNGTGFGIGFSVVRDNAEKKILGSEGTVGWEGVAGTYFGIDPKENMIFILMIQLIDFNDLYITNRFKTMVYQSIVENFD